MSNQSTVSAKVIRESNWCMTWEASSTLIVSPSKSERAAH
jgi:hypothetical protein